MEPEPKERRVAKGAAALDGRHGGDTSEVDIPVQLPSFYLFIYAVLNRYHVQINSSSSLRIDSDIKHRRVRH